jgi:hypothetical protein
MRLCTRNRDAILFFVLGMLINTAPYVSGATLDTPPSSGNDDCVHVRTRVTFIITKAFVTSVTPRHFIGWNFPTAHDHFLPYLLQAKAVPLHAMKALGGEEV